MDTTREPTYANETITPEMAAEYLEQFDKKRPIRWRKVEEFRRAMEDGTWYLTGEGGLVFDWNGTPINGRHRYTACVQAGVPFRSLVSRGVNPEAFVGIDGGSSRQFKDDLAHEGLVNAVQLAGMMRKVTFWQHNALRDEYGRGGLAGLTKYSISRAELNELWPSYAKEISEAVAATHKYHKSFPGDRGALTFMWWLLTSMGNSPELIDRYFTIICNGSEDRANLVLVKLREVLGGQVSKYRMDRGQTSMEYQVYWMIKNWTRWVNGSRMPSFVLPEGGLSNPFPVPQVAR